MSKVLIVDDNEDVLLAAKLLLRPYSSIVITEKDPNQIPKLITSDSFDVIFTVINYC